MPSKKENISAASAVLSLGLDIGSTTAKIVLMEDGEVLYQRYERHFSHVRQKALEMVQAASAFLDGRTIHVAIAGSAGLGLAKAADIPFVQEVFATAETVRNYAPDTDVVVELGGEDAKVIFFRGGLDERFLSYTTPFVMLTAAGFTLFCLRRRLPPSARLSAAARCTLGVYLLHPMLILIPQHLGIWEPAVLPLWLAVPLRALGVYAVTLAISLLLSRVPAVGRLVA